MQIKMTDWMQAMHRSNAKSSGMQISGAKSDAGNGANKKLSGNSASNAASVDLSKSGRYKARMLKESKQCDSADDVMQKAESTIDDIIDTVKSGGKLTREQERIFNEGMKDIASKHYKDMKDMKLSAGDVLLELKENYLLDYILHLLFTFKRLAPLTYLPILLIKNVFRSIHHDLCHL